ncbi:MAG TPA: MBL fold metallo-hydrolase [Candidatus Limnocylindrales bacterium]|nr:MBL fold metallo-hydrolase [Candidatus Limnocylindrales bacterium]
MTQAIDISRRSFLVHAGRGTIALAVLSVAGCGPGTVATAVPSTEPSTGPSVEPSPSDAASLAPSATGDGSSSAPPSTAAGGVTWQRANLGFVSAYVLVRAGEAAIVDTGTPGSEARIGEALVAAGVDWPQVGHVILTHKHGDHAGSIAAVLQEATEAAVYAGQADIPNIESPRPISAVADGDMVFGLRIVATPGHTIGHVAVLDETGGILVAGDALGTTGGTLAGSNPSFTEDAEQAKASVVKLGKLTFETLLVGHGEPILKGASGQVAALAARS